MFKLIRFIGLVSQSIFIQFLHLFGLVAFLASAAMGWLRLPSWLVPVLAVICGVISDKFINDADVNSILEKAHNADQRGGFLIVVYFVICAVGYVVGAYGRVYARSKGLPLALKK
jgi:cbb3-type cytochrome oxidase subunit 3